jgi:hypothetical protein
VQSSYVDANVIHFVSIHLEIKQVMLLQLQIELSIFFNNAARKQVLDLVNQINTKLTMHLDIDTPIFPTQQTNRLVLTIHPESRHI